MHVFWNSLTRYWIIHTYSSRRRIHTIWTSRKKFGSFLNLDQHACILYVFACICMYFGMYLVCICMYLYVLFVSKRLAILHAKIHANTCNTWKYWSRYVQIRTQNTSKYIQINQFIFACIFMHMHVSDTMCMCMISQQFACTSYTFNTCIYMKYVHHKCRWSVYVCICIYMHVFAQYMFVL